MSPCSEVLTLTRARMRELEAGEAGLLVVNVSCIRPCCILVVPTFPFCPFALVGTMRSALLLAAILALSLAQGAVCEESQEQMVPRGGRKEVRYPSSWACPGRVLGNIMRAALCWSQKL